MRYFFVKYLLSTELIAFFSCKNFIRIQTTTKCDASIGEGEKKLLIALNFLVK